MISTTLLTRPPVTDLQPPFLFFPFKKALWQPCLYVAELENPLFSSAIQREENGGAKQAAQKKE